MTHFVHHVPGRMRVKTPALKRNEARGRMVKGYLDTMEGVSSAEVNTVTGSIVIKYDHAVVQGTTILNSLHGMGLVMHPSHPAVFTGGVSYGQKMSDTVMNKLFETVIEKSAIALIAAII